MGQQCSQEDHCCSSSRGEVKEVESQSALSGLFQGKESGKHGDVSSDNWEAADEILECSNSKGIDPAGVNSPNYFEREIVELKIMAGRSGSAPSGTIKFSSGATYTGEWRGFARHGFGRMTWPDGTMYEGQWKENRAHGRGRFKHSNGDEYIGEWKKNVADGVGTYHSKRMTYVGQWRDDLQHGFGKEEWEGEPGGYAGEFRNGAKQGSGIFRWPDGSQYIGSWGAGSIDGPGVYIGDDGRWYKGEWNDSVMHGNGMYSWPDGREYRGEYRVDRKEGFGSFFWPDGRRYDGYWHAGRQNGYGRYIDAEGCIFNGYFSKGRRLGQAPFKTIAQSFSTASTATDSTLSAGGESHMPINHHRGILRSKHSKHKSSAVSLSPLGTIPDCATDGSASRRSC